MRLLLMLWYFKRGYNDVFTKLRCLYVEIRESDGAIHTLYSNTKFSHLSSNILFNKDYAWIHKFIELMRLENRGKWSRSWNAYRVTLAKISSIKNVIKARSAPILQMKKELCKSFNDSFLGPIFVLLPRTLRWVSLHCLLFGQWICFQCWINPLSDIIKILFKNIVLAHIIKNLIITCTN